MELILQDFLVKKKEGFYCSYGDFYIDPMHPVQNAVVSHAHGDHASPGHQRVFCTEPTAEIMKLRYGTRRNEAYITQGFVKPFQIGPVEIQFFPAGHILGSCQILMRFEGVTYLYSGDIKIQNDATCEPLQFVNADVLITETTFAHPDFVHPDPQEEIRKLDSIKTNIMLGAYSLGKAQRLNLMISELLSSEKQVFVHHSMHGIHKIYEKFGFSVGRYQLYNRKMLKEISENAIYLLPPTTFRSYIRAKGVVRVFATGWKNQNQADVLLSISDHVDWKDLLHYIEQVSPKQIWTVHGDPRYLKMHFLHLIPIRELTSQDFA